MAAQAKMCSTTTTALQLATEPVPLENFTTVGGVSESLQNLFALLACIFLSCSVLYLISAFQLWQQIQQTPLIPVTPSFTEFVSYYCTLRLDYLFTALFCGLVHGCRKRLFKYGFLQERKAKASQLGELFLDTSLSMFYQKKLSTRDQAVFVATTFYMPKQSRILPVDGPLVVHVSLRDRRVISASLSGNGLDMSSALRLSWWLLIMCHSQNHAAGALAYNYDGLELNETRQSRIYTVGINLAAETGPAYWGGVGSCDDMRSLLHQNIKIPLPKHTAVTFQDLAPYSKTIPFLLKARSASFEILRKYNIDVNPELFFLCTILHSIDHYAAAECVDALSLIGDEELTNDGDWIRALFVERIWAVLANTRLRNSRVGWHREWYRTLHAIDAKLADEVDWCIAF